MTRARSGSRADGAGESSRDGARQVAPGKATRTQRLGSSGRAAVAPRTAEPSLATADDGGGSPVQLLADDPFALHLLPAQDVAGVAAAGTQGPGQALPHGERIQESFGRHDVSGVRAHVGGAAAEAAAGIGARAYAMGNDVAFADAPDLHTAAHEAAHVVQQRGGLQLYGGVGQAGDRYEQHADAVADAVVRGESAEALLDGMAGGGPSATAAVQRQEGSSERGASAAGRPGDVGTAAAALSEAVDLAQLGLARNKPLPDGDLGRVQNAVKAVADVLHTHAGKLPKADAKALDKALAAAYSLANALTVGQHARPALGHELRKTIAGLQKLVDDPRNDEPARKPGELIPLAADSLAKLRVARMHVTERILDYPSADLHGLDEAIGETTEWVAELSSEHGDKVARRLGRAVMDQAAVVAQVVPELEAFLAQPLTESSDEVVAGFVVALAKSTSRSDTARKAIARATMLRQRQRFDRPRAEIESNVEEVAKLGELDKKEGNEARRQQHRLERRVEQMEKRVLAGGRVSNLDRDELLVEAREHSYRTHVRVLELQLRETANGLDQLDDGFTGGVNRYSNEIPALVSDLRGMARVAAAAISGYQERVELIEQEASKIEDEAQRRRKIATDKLAALDWMVAFVKDHLDNARLVDRLNAAMAVAESAQTRLFLANLVTTVVMTLAGNLAASAARGAAEGAWLARAGAAGADALEAAQAAKVAGTVAGAATDVVVNSVGQKALGDKRSFLDIVAANALTGIAVHAVQIHFVKIEHMIDDVSATGAWWRKIAPTVSTHAKKFAVALPELTMSMIVGAATDHAYTMARGYETPPANQDELVSQWMAQGAAMAFGRHIAAHTKAFRDLSARLQDGARKYAHTRVLAMDIEVRANGVMQSGDIKHAQAVLAQYETLLAVERAMIADKLEESHPNRRLPSDTLEEAAPAGAGRTHDDSSEPEPTEPQRTDDHPPVDAPGVERIDATRYRPAERPRSGTMPKDLLVDQQTGKHYLFKPNHPDAPLPKRAVDRGLSAETIAQRAKASQIAADQLAIDTPEVRLVEYNGQVGSLQEWRTSKNTYALGELEQTDPALFAKVMASPEYARLRADLDTLDYVLNNLDRNPDNLLVTVDDNGNITDLTAIDHDLTFTSGADRFIDELGIWARDLPDRYSRAMVDRLRAIAANPDGFRNALRAYLRPGEIEAAIVRVHRVLADVDAKIATRGPDGTFFGESALASGDEAPTNAHVTTVESVGPALTSGTAWDPQDDALMRSLMERAFPRNKLHRVEKALNALRRSPFGAELARRLKDPRIQAAEGFDTAVTRLLPATVAEHEALLAELLEAELMVAEIGADAKLVLGRKSLGTKRGDPSHYDADVASVVGQDQMLEARQVYRAQTTNLRNAIYEGLTKAEEQLGAAPAAQRRLVIYLKEGTSGALSDHAEIITDVVRRRNIEVEVVLPDGRRVRYTFERTAHT